MMKIERRSLIICAVVGFLGLLSAILGFAAEGKRIKASQVVETSPGVCSYPKSPAYALGITAAFALLFAQITIAVVSGCFCCRRNSFPSTTHWALALVCFIISWFTFVLAFLVFLGGAFLNNQHGEQDAYLSYYHCYVLKPGVFSTASVLALASVALGILYYVTLSSGKLVSNPVGTNQSGIAMGEPQVPPTSHDPFFVPEDTYIRRQFT